MVPVSNLIDIDRQQVMHSIGYCADSEPSTRVVSLVNEYADNACQLIEPSYSCVIRDIKSVQGNRTVIDGSIAFESKVIARLLEQCEQVAVFALTIGDHLEETACHLAEDGRILQAAVLDAIGSVAAEKVADFVQDRVRKVVSARKFCISQRFSPGYCDWDVSQQKMLFRVMNADSAGIRLTGGCLMLPRKSISGIIGIGSCNSGVENYNPCETCDKHNNCMWKR